MKAALALARVRGIRRVELEVYPSNTAALRLYERLGFRREGVRRGARILDGRTEDLVLMAWHADAEERAACVEPDVLVLFYGSYMNRAVLREVGLAPRRFEVASLAGFEVRIAPCANLVRSPGARCSACSRATHAELERLYAHARDVLGEVYLPARDSRPGIWRGSSLSRPH